MRQPLAAVLLTSLALAGCAGSSTLLPATTKVLDDLPKVENSPKAPCWQQKQIAAQNSYLATIREGREMIYVAPCAARPERLEPSAPPHKPVVTSALPAART